MTDITKVYWDSCAWIALIKQEENRHDDLKTVYELARRGSIEIWTSTFTYAEVYKKKCGLEDHSGAYSFSETLLDELDDVLSQDFIKRIELNQIIGVQARRVLINTVGLSKPQDAVHLASALYYNLDVMHTFDESDLLKFDNKIERRDGDLLRILVPSDELNGPLFSQNDE